MIEGIVLIFVILFLILVVPFIKDWYKASNKETVSYKVFKEPENPQAGDIWFY